MSFSNWLHNAAIRGCLIGLALLLPGPALGQVEPKPEESSAQTQARDQSDPAAITGATLRSIFDEAMKAYAREKAAADDADKRKESRDDAALLAQQEATRWAFWSAAIAGFALFANAVAIGLVWLTFRETKRTADAAIVAANASRQSADAAVKLELPVIKVRTPTLYALNGPAPSTPGAIYNAVVRELPGEFSTVPKFFLANHGRTVASLRGLSIGWEIGPKLTSATYREWFDLGGQALAAATDGYEIFAPFTLRLRQKDIDGLLSRECRFWLHISVEYDDFLGELRIDRFCWQWSWPNPIGREVFLRVSAFAPVYDVPSAYIAKGLMDRESYTQPTGERCESSGSQP